MESAIISNSSSGQNSLCRVCLSANENNKCIFTSHKGHENDSFTDLLSKLQLYGGIEVSQNDGFPAKMCDKCISKMCIAHCFRVQCQETDRLLRSANENDANVRCWMRADDDLAKTNTGECDESQKIEEICDKELEKLENICGESTTSPVTKNNVACHLSKKSEKYISIDCISLDDPSISKTESHRSREKVVAPKINAVEHQREEWRLNDERTIDDYDDIGASGRLSGDSKNDRCNDAAGEKEETPLSKRETFRSRRFVVFKRMTSMQSLKNRKEQQRQYIKKTLQTKHDSDERDAVQTRKSTCGEQVQLPNGNNDLQHECRKCGESYSSSESLKTHELSHENEKFSCDRCERIFGSRDEFLEHGKSHETRDKHEPAICKICDKNFRKTATMVRHLNVHKRDNPRAVYSILKDIRDKRKRGSAEASTDGERDFDTLEKKLASEIGKCTAKLRDDRAFAPYAFDAVLNNENDRVDLDENYVFDCAQCGKRYSDEDSLRKHLSSHEEPPGASDEKLFDDEGPNIRTESCDPTRDEARRKSRFHRDSVPQNPPDDRSAIKIINIWIKEELDSDNEGKGFPCRSCSKSYVTKKSLSKHRAKMHENHSESFCSSCQTKDCTCGERIEESRVESREKSKIYTCEECNKTFEKETKLEKHARIHARAKEQQDTNFKRFLCHICSKTFRQNTGLMFHMRTHTGYKPHVCKYCGRGFTSNSNCINHERTHTGDRPFVCHFCSAAFAKSCTLKAHITTHTGEANYHCKTCGKSFRRLKYLKEHRFTHTGEKPYACKICGTAYSHSGSLFVHEKKCKAQHGNYQALSVPVSQNYCQNPSVTMGESSVAIAPILETLSSAHDITAIDNSLRPHESKNYVDDVARINAHCTNDSTDSQIHSSTMNPDVPAAVRSFTIIGQMFHT